MQAITSINSPYYDKYQLRPYNPAELYQRFTYKIYDEMRTDDQISAILELKKSTIINSGFQIQSNVPEVQAWLMEQLEDVDFEQALYQMLTGMDYGFSLTEITLGESEGLIGLGSLKTRAPHTFEFQQADSGDVTVVKQYGGKGGDLWIPYDKFIHYTHGPEFDNPYGNSEMNRGVYTAWWSKKAVIKFWNIYLERFGSPLAVGQYDAARTPQEQIEQFINVLNNLQSKTSIVLPEGLKLEFIEATKGGEGFERAIDKYNMLIARKMVVPDLMGMGGAETAGGSYALGGIQHKIFLQTLERPRRQLGRAINRNLIKPLLELNFPEGVEAEFVWKPMSEDYAMEKVKLVMEAFSKGGLTKQESDEVWIRDIVGMPEVEVPEPQILPEQPQEPMPHEAPLPPQQQEIPQDGELGQEVGEAVQPTLPDGPEEERQATRAYAAVQYDRKCDYAAMERFMDDESARMVEQLGRVVRESVNGVVSQIKKKNIIGKQSLGAINNLDLRGWDQFRMVLKRGFRGAMDHARGQARNETKDSTKKNMIDSGAVNIDPSEYLDDLTTNISALQKTQILDKIKTVLREGIRAGKGVTQIMGEIDAALKEWDTSAQRVTAKAEMVSANKLEALVRTNLTNVYNEARMDEFEKEPELIQAYQFSAIMDGRTTDICESLHGKIFSPSEARAYLPPRHYNCRSVMVPITILEEKPTVTPKSELPAVTSKF